ncbi:hypothetical protein BTR22_07005 [Alkalihalophilus pseudofirmus]|uniref:hypothetical protein n=1 Tax=Alkalihalophilus pseudofirmus TaxID=79885 RepID=UPI000950E56D|nr:hypothetical protein BTR22_07005 [Alkalihalophilus pseudofirmus]
MKSKTKVLITLISSLLIFSFGMFRILTESLSSTPLFVAYIFVMAGLIGAVANGLILRKGRMN